MRALSTLSIAMLLGTASLEAAHACTTFCMSDGKSVVFGRNYDFEFGDGMLLVNKRGMNKFGSARENPAHWISKYGSVTFNQYGRDAPQGGVNEKGLVVELMWLDATKYPARDQRPNLGQVEWIQYLLDNYATVGEVLARADDLRIFGRAPIHYLVSDRTGNAAVLEFLDGKLVVTTGKDLPDKALANDTYANARAHADTKTGQSPAFTRSSLDRFAAAAAGVKQFESAGSGKSPVAESFAILDRVAQPGYTRWKIVYDLTALRIHWRTDRNDNVRHLDIGKLDFSCSSPIQYLALYNEGNGNAIASLTDFNAQTNLDMIATSYRKTSFMANVPPEAAKASAAHPEKFTCNLSLKLSGAFS
jgi:penicillin V acylase-like amidase (Ntn superfamily)